MGDFFIAPRHKNDIVLQDGFKSSEEARTYLREHEAEMQERYRNLMEGTKTERKENRPRVGRDYRAGKDVQAEEFRETFGFRGVEFGNWTNQSDRQNSLNEAYDALMDLASVCGVSPKALSLDGKLGIAFGARGGGKSNAHYERDKVVINLTKTNGAGSLAHEWFHALDHYFAGNGLLMTTDAPHLAERKEMREAWRALKNKIASSEYYQRSMRYARLHSSDYWAKPTELGARAFSTWVINQLSRQGTTNDYLANELILREDEATDSQKKYNVYPMDKDADWMDEAFGGLFSTMQERVDESTGNHILYQKSDGTMEAGVSSREAALRDALVERMRKAGLDVSMDVEEGQRVLDEENGRVREHRGKQSDAAKKRNELLRDWDRSVASVIGRDSNEVGEERKRRFNEYKEETKNLYDRVLSGNFDEVTLQAIDDYIDKATPLNRYGRPIYQRLPQRVGQKVHGGERTGRVDALISRISESAVRADGETLSGAGGAGTVKEKARTPEEKARAVEETKRILLKGWAIATGNWHTDISDFTDASEPIGRGKDSDVYESKDGKHVIKVSKGKPEGKRFRPDIDDVALFNAIFPNCKYTIVGYGEIDGKFVRFLQQPMVDFKESKPLTVEERVAYMKKLGFEPINKEKTAFSNGEIVASDLQKNNIVKDGSGNVRVIDADMKLHTKDVGGKYTYPDVETDLPAAKNDGGSDGIRFFRTPDGEAYGFTVGGKIYIDPRIATSETPIHEYSHPWGDMLRRADPKQWAHLVKELKGSHLWEKVKENYPKLKTDDEIADETFATFSGRRGAEKLRKEMDEILNGDGSVTEKAAALSALERVKKAISDFWRAVLKMFGINRYYRADELADMALKDLLEGKSPLKNETTMERGEVGKSLATSGSYFSGGGLLEEGLKGLIDPKVAVEYSEKIAGVYSDNHGNHIVVADVRDVDPKQLVSQVEGGEVQYFHASPVCKNFSSAKQNGGEVELDMETAKSTAEFIAATRPKVVTIENVKRYKNSEALKLITDELTRQGYDWDADVYKDSDFGGYTKRERLIVRAKRDGELPPKPTKVPEELRKQGWMSAVEDLIPTLEEKRGGLSPSTEERLKNSGIDWRTVDKPLYVLGRGNADRTVSHAYADEVLPTLTTGGGDVIVMPGGKVLKVSPRLLARVTGLSDDYKMPPTDKWAHTIIGNGIPARMTEHVIGPLIHNAIPASERATQRSESVFDAARRVSEADENKFVEISEREKQVAELNDKFNEELKQQAKGELKEGHIYQLGTPSEVLLSTGIPDVPIEMSAKRLAEKATLFGHNFDIKDINGLVNTIQKPLAIFEYGNKDKAQNIVVEMQKDGKNFIVGLSLKPVVNGRKLEINSIRNVFPKDNAEWLNWISKDRHLYVDKEKIQALINQQRTNLADVEYLDLDDVTNKVENFENPKFLDGKVEDERTKFRLLADNDPKTKALEALPKGELVPVYRNVQAFSDDALGSPMAFFDAETGERRTLEGGRWNYSEAPKVELTEEQQRKLDELNKNGYLMVDGKKTTELPISDSLKFVKPKTKEAQLQYLLKKNPEDSGTWAAYDPYDHAIETPLNTQFAEAYKRPNLVVVRSLIPKSEITEPFQADYALLPTGAHQWNNGRTLYLSRYSKIDKVLSRKEEAELIDKYWKEHEGKREALKSHRDYNRFVPEVRKELENMGYRFELDGKELTPEESLALDKQREAEIIPGREGRAPYITGEDIDRINAKMAGKWVGEPKEAMEDEMAARVDDLSKKLNTPVRIVRTDEEVEALPTDRQRRQKGSYNTRTGEVTIVVPNNANLADVENTFMHEVVGHDGLRVLFPEKEKLDNALDELYGASNDSIKATIDRRAQKMYDAEVERLLGQKRSEAEARAEADRMRDQFKRDATEEYGADLAGRIGEEGFEKMSAEEKTFWGKLKAVLQKALDALLHGLKIPGKRKWGDKDWAYVLHEAYKRKKNGGRPSVFDVADTEAMREKTGFGESTDNSVMFRDGSPVKARDLYEKKVKSSRFQAREALQDSMLGLKTMMESVMKAEGKRDSDARRQGAE